MRTEDQSDRTVPYLPSSVRSGTPLHYEHGPDSSRRDGVPAGRIERFVWDTSAVYPGTSRTVHVYVPDQYRHGDAADLMVFQDGGLYLDPALDMRAGVVMDNLIADGSMRPTIGVCVDPGEPANRNAEYDPADDRYATFLHTEIIPTVRERYRLTIEDDPQRRAICGGSSGGNAAFTVAWHRPDSFSRVLTFVASWPQIPGGNLYPALIRNDPTKPLRVFMQADRFDLGHDQADRNWYSSNLTMAAALAERGYAHRLVLGDGGHSPHYGGVVLPDALRWLWRD